MQHNTPSLQTSKGLKDAGFPQKAQLYWVITSTTNYHLSWYEGELPLALEKRNDWYAAPTAQELADEFISMGQLDISHYGGKWTAKLMREPGLGRGDSIAEALASLYIKLNGDSKS